MVSPRPTTSTSSSTPLTYASIIQDKASKQVKIIIYLTIFGVKFYRFSFCLLPWTGAFSPIRERWVDPFQAGGRSDL